MMRCDGRRYYRRDGTAYAEGFAGMLMWAKDYEDPALQRVVLSRSMYGERISTVWTGLNHQWSEGEPLIFETMIFPRTGVEIYVGRYSTEAQALREHRRLQLQTLVPWSWLRAILFSNWRR
jgi:hypothetical protein